MMTVVPAINEVSFEELLKKIEIAREFKAPFIKFDIADGDFSSVKTWSDSSLLASLPTDLFYEIHFMWRETDSFFEEWLKKPVTRFIFHIETTKNPLIIKERCEALKIVPVLAMVFDSDWALIEPYIVKFNAFQVLAVVPGKSHQKFDERALKLIANLRKIKPSATIEVDGGVNEISAPLFVEAGADMLASTSFIFDSINPIASYKKLLNI
ncbi:MAG: hypothetical protein COV57_00855 [Candidatus Liptonbacteria bacterium CG11_big_fil_rev_8_21_14_0_20_35_14]|uniref:Ribulose-phosphate 3-epimerase n=1 Tax=Candidatus Liptonbacteria bacterium CG11_big_fil_rev_8_21_14_0_20_35_14 TaxID=1974634 RepID=A0A2H0NAE9_9BACT|nr:MAG: hypothetical protein COV57_00855 [Candidatus Liptonbacteria bacterium CG11_big_fil_rev_8_21_14_0_20_35_14]